VFSGIYGLLFGRISFFIIAYAAFSLDVLLALLAGWRRSGAARPTPIITDPSPLGIHHDRRPLTPTGWLEVGRARQAGRDEACEWGPCGPVLLNFCERVDAASFLGVPMQRSFADHNYALITLFTDWSYGSTP